MAPYAQHAEDLLRAISELDLTALRARANSEVEKTPFENGPTYSTEELFKMRAQKEPEAEDEQAEVGLKSPELPVAPPSTPAHPSPGPTASNPEDGEPSFTPLEDIAEDDTLEIRAPSESGPKYTSEELIKLKPAQEPDTGAHAHDDNGQTQEQAKEELGEPPEEIRIRRQVEYYFSDDNLPDDVFLWKRTEGSSKPIAVEKIASFGRMRQFEYSTVVAALKKSKFLIITGSEGQEMVKRKKLYDPANPISHADTYTDYDKYPDAPRPADISQLGDKSKKKHSKKGGLGSVAPKVKQPKPTGFEDYYADPPMTPEEAIDAYEDFYHPELPFHERMQNCIQRYRGRRKLDEKKSHIFTQYLTLGGINSGAKQFTGGLDEATLEDCTADEIRAIRATDLVGGGGKNSKLYDPKYAENWVVDFEGVAKGFFSYRVPINLHYKTEADIKLCSTIIKNFLNYVLAQGACPEYTDDIMAARRVCDRAEKELWEIEQLSKLLPGSYNIAASTLYGGQYKDQYFSTESDTWDVGDETEKPAPFEYGMIDAKADRIFKTAVAFHNKEAAELLIKGKAKLTKVENCCFEVVEIERPKIEMIDLVARIKDHNNQTGNIKPLGLLKVKHWDGPGLVEEDCSDNESTKALEFSDAIETFWFEDEILKHCFVGMKLEVVVRGLDIGVKYCDVIPGTYCSFFTYLENEKMKDWKEPVPNERPPPTEDNPDAEAVTDAELKDFD